MALGLRQPTDFHTPGYRKIAYNLQLHYDGYQDDLLERVHDKMQFERERLLNTTNKSSIDTFEHFIHYTEEDELNNAARKQGENTLGR